MPDVERLSDSNLRRTGVVTRRHESDVRDPAPVRSETESVDLDDPLLQRLAQAPDLPYEPAEALGPYRLIEPLGRGGMGMVYRAEHRGTGAIVALKTVRVPNQQMLAGIRREIHTLAGMRHPGIVRIVAEGLHQGVPWYAMELVDGQTLRQRRLALQPPAEAETRVDSKYSTPSWWTLSLPTQAPTPAAFPSRVMPPLHPAERQEALTLIRRLCAPLAYLHGEGLVHRDLKPENVLVRSDGQPILVDF